MKKVILATLVFAIAGAATAAYAGVDFSVNIGIPAPAPVVVAPQPVVVPNEYPPPPAVVVPNEYPAPPTLVVEQPPSFIYSPQLGLYLSVGTPYDMAYADGGYYLYNAGYWYYSPSYWGPWSFAGRRNLPLGLRRYRYEQVRHYRDREYRFYQRDRDHYRGYWYNPAPRGPEHLGRRAEYREGWRGEHEGWRGEHEGWRGEHEGWRGEHRDHWEDRR